ncbi:hypothetical protein [Methylophilus sp. 3sh_L]
MPDFPYGGFQLTYTAGLKTTLAQLSVLPKSVHQFASWQCMFAS